MEVDKRESSGYNDQAVFSREQICGCAGTGRQASLRCWCRIDVWVQVPSAAPSVLLEEPVHHARVVELADSLDSGSSVLYGRAGSSPASRTREQGPVSAGAGPLSFSSVRPDKFITMRASGGIGRLARFRF